MADLEKVMKGLECCAKKDCSPCPYNDETGCIDALMPDALSQLKAMNEVIAAIRKAVRLKNG